jgi:hypothetical protein
MKPFPLEDAKHPVTSSAKHGRQMHSPAAQSLPSFVLMLMFEDEIYAIGWYAQCFFEARFQQMK